MNWLALCLAVHSAATPDVEPVTPAMVVSVAAPVAPTKPFESEALDAPMVIAALRLRLGRTTLPIREWSETARAGDWLLDVSPQGSDRLLVRIVAPDGEVLLDSSLATRRRHPRDLAHTIALLAIEVLTPLLPEIAARRAAEEQRRQVPAVQRSTDPGKTHQGAPRSSWRLAAGAESALLIPQERVGFGVGALAEWRRAMWLARLGGAWWLPVTKVAERYRLEMSHATAHVGVGAAWRPGRWAFSASTGPAVRFLRAEANRPREPTETRHNIDWGWGAMLAGGAQVGSMEVEVGCDVRQYGRHPRYVVDGEVAVNPGHTSVGLAVRLGWLL